MKRLLLIVILINAIGFGQEETTIDTTWQTELIGSLSFSESYFDNWASGGENTIAGQFDLSGKIINNNEKYKWISTGKLAYGTSKIAEADAKKTIDEVKVESIISYITKLPADPYFSIKGETQVAPGYSYTEDVSTQISAFLDPAYFTQSLGMIYNPTEGISARIGAAIKETITNNYPAPFADDPETEEIEKTKIEPGIETVFGFTKKISDTAQINSTLDLFNNLKGFDATDVKWDTDITASVTKYINVKLSIKLFYDKDISTKRQLNQSLMLGVSYAIL